VEATSCCFIVEATSCRLLEFGKQHLVACAAEASDPPHENAAHFRGDTGNPIPSLSWSVAKAGFPLSSAQAFAIQQFRFHLCSLNLLDHRSGAMKAVLCILTNKDA